MSQISVVPDIVRAAGGYLENIGDGLRTAHAAAVASTTAIAAPAADEVSAAITAIFDTYGRQFQTFSAQRAAFHDNFVSLLNGGAVQYLSAEAANARQASNLSLPGSGPSTAAASAETFVNNLQSISQNSNFGPLLFSSSLSPAGAYQSVTLAGPLGPVGSFSLSARPIIPSSLGGGLGFVANAMGNLNTPAGPLTWLSAGGSVFISPTGGFVGSMSGPTPFGQAAISVSGPVPFLVTGGSVTALGMQFYFQGTQFGVVPLFLQPLGLGL